MSTSRFLTLALSLCLLAAGAGAPQKRFPPGVLDERRAPTEPPARPRRVSADPAELKRDADELARLAESVPADVESAAKGLLPKDLNEKLKRIEKLAKHLRSALAR